MGNLPPGFDMSKLQAQMQQQQHHTTPDVDVNE